MAFVPCATSFDVVSIVQVHVYIADVINASWDYCGLHGLPVRGIPGEIIYNW